MRIRVSKHSNVARYFRPEKAKRRRTQIEFIDHFDAPRPRHGDVSSRLLDRAGNSPVPRRPGGPLPLPSTARTSHLPLPSRHQRLYTRFWKVAGVLGGVWEGKLQGRLVYGLEIGFALVLCMDALRRTTKAEGMGLAALLAALAGEASAVMRALRGSASRSGTAFVPYRQAGRSTPCPPFCRTWRAG